jgi:hypothetical protein
LFCHIRTGGGAVGFHAGFPDGNDIAGGKNILCRVALYEKKIGAKARSDAAAVVEAK